MIQFLKHLLKMEQEDKYNKEEEDKDVAEELPTLGISVGDKAPSRDKFGG